MDRITKIRIRNVRAIEAVTLDLSRPLTVLIGENGSGKSTILECLEILKKSAQSTFFDAFFTIHRGMPGLLRKGATDLSLGVRIESDEPEGDQLDYSFTLRQVGGVLSIASESLVNARDGFKILYDHGTGLRVYTGRDWTDVPRSGTGLGISTFGLVAPDSRIDRVLAALRGIEVHLPFDSRASWAARTYQRPETLRAANTLFPADRLSLLATNLSNAWAELRSREEAHWSETLSLTKLGLGDRLDSVVITPDPGGGNVYLALRFKDLAAPVLAADLSDGQLSWLAFVAMARLGSGRSLLAVDEPELHLHPALLGRVVSMLANLPGGAPVLLSTHSDRVLEVLDDPADAIRVCALQGSRASLSRIDAAELPKWLDEYGDIGQLRAAGYLPRVLKASPAVGETAQEAE